jgi:hypothetical protein
MQNLTFKPRNLLIGIKQIRLSKGLYALVDAEIYDYLCQWTWYASEESRGTKFYAVRRERVNGKPVKIRMHRVVIEYYDGPIPEGLVVDHHSHNSLDNRYINLETVTQTVNMSRSPGWKKKGQKLNGHRT